MYLLLLLFVFVGTACTEKLEKEEVSFVDDNSFAVSKDVACKIAMSYSASNNHALRSMQGLQEKKIASTLSVENDRAEPTMHVINYENGGFVIIAGDNRLDPILAYSTTGEFPSVEESEMPFGLVLWIKNKEDIIDFYNKNNMEQMPSVKYAWDVLMNTELGTKAVTPPSICKQGDQEWHINIGPLLKTTWGQGVGYNDMLGTMSCGGFTKNYLAGCVTTAVAQVANFYKYPTTYQWNSMCANTSELQRLYKDIFDTFNSYGAITNIDCNNTSIKFSYVDDIFKSKWGYKNAVLDTYNSYQSLVDPLSNGHPIIAANKDHAWIYDGCQHWNECVVDGQWIGYLLFHINWGWNGKYDAWYGFNDVNVGGVKYTPLLYVTIYK